MKKIMLIAIFSLLAINCGCKQKEKYQNIEVDGTNVMMKADFNQEHYIWENWTSPKNKTTGK